MTTLKSVIEMICNHKVSSVKKRHLYLAYLMMHMQNPGLHPDDHMSAQGGYEGYQVILCEEALTRNTGTVPDNFHYPTSFLQLESVLNELDGFHQDMVNDNPSDTNIEYLAMVHFISYFIYEMKSSELEEAVDSLQRLYLYHASETSTEEEEGKRITDILKDCADILNWIQQFSD